MTHSDHQHASGTQGDSRHHGRAYWLLALNLVLSFVAMYLVMFAMIDGWADFNNNVNTVYMALMMLAPMAVLMLATMGAMYRRKAWNVALYAGFVAIFVLSFLAIRSQALVGDRQFIASMIPHHSGAILMCREAQLEDAELQALCVQISEGQRREIEQMEAIAERLRAAASGGGG
ncbi:MAG TPA: DUF305 domain-containing protein [Kiloniellales bacterium]|nr:DUF305 domain-containing protein [Kiloniellales bacterium]